MRVFVTGATGVVGIRAVPLLIGAGHAVTGVGRTSDKRRRLEQLGAATVDVGLFDATALTSAMRGHDVVINLATHIPPANRMLLPWAWKENDRIRTDGSRALVDAALAAGVSRFVQESFALSYADAGDAWIDETAPIRHARNSRTTQDAEESAARFGRSGRTAIVLRFAGFYGPDPFFRQMLGALRRGWSPIPGPPSAYFTTVSHDDAATAVVAALTAPAGTYNVAETDPMRRGEWLASLARVIGARAPRPMPKLMSKLGGSPMELLSRSLRISSTKFRDATGWTPRYPNAAAAFSAVVRELGT
jgi:nucleoside-diphosphate-sugar epimerase